MLTSPATWVQLYVYPSLTALVLWCGLTAGLLWLNRRGVGLARLALLLAVAPLLLAHEQLWLVRDDVSVAGCYRSFAAGMFIWAWHELAFYSGVITGPWREPCPSGVRGLDRFTYALATHLYHELAIAFEVMMLWALHSNRPNVIGPLTFVLLWALLHSAKLNVLLGVRTLSVNWLPDHLRYLGSFWRRRWSNFFFLPSLLGFSLIAVTLWQRVGSLAGDGRAVGIALLAVLTTLGAIEHLMLALPIHSRSGSARARKALAPGAAPHDAAAP